MPPVARLDHRGRRRRLRALLVDELFPHLQAELTPRGYRGHRLLRRDLGSECEFVALTFFTSADAVKAFAGDDATRAVISPKACALLSRFDEHAAHYRIASLGAAARERAVQ